ncbi:hypothetical protein PsorP6_014565 [Peronosclerospora sorghi]|uniref:Uncharacterized protein n=1 Tax=Peronosclerospora sorghi TaxID=230839 RepID=A0ACC0VS75_9STRA|nr:hypothetical protein PsorP6_014565 [Peronosclerospora sorghi]
MAQKHILEVTSLRLRMSMFHYLGGVCPASMSSIDSANRTILCDLVVVQKFESRLAFPISRPSTADNDLLEHEVIITTATGTDGPDQFYK